MACDFRLGFARENRNADGPVADQRTGASTSGAIDTLDADTRLTGGSSESIARQSAVHIIKDKLGTGEGQCGIALSAAIDLPL